MHGRTEAPHTKSAEMLAGTGSLFFRTLLDAQRRVYGDAHQRTSDIIETLLAIARFRKKLFERRDGTFGY